MNIKKFLTLAVLTLLVTSMFTGCGESYDKNVQVVRQGAFHGYPNVPVGKAFDKFFSNGKWRSFKSTENQTVVEFTGGCTLFDLPATLTMQFIVNGTQFEVHYVEIDEIPIEYIEIPSIIDKIMSEYKH